MRIRVLVSSSALIQTCDGLILLSEITGDTQYQDIAIRAIQWVNRIQYMKGEGLIHDFYDPDYKEIILEGDQPRALNDNAMFLKIGKLAKDEELVQNFYEICNRLLKDEDTPGNWMTYWPSSKELQRIHPRHAFWWGWPMIDAYKDSDNEKYLDCAIRCGEWYLNAVRSDGGMIRETFVDFKTASFGHSTSGSACAVLLWNDLYHTTQDERWLEPITRCLNFCRKMQFTNPMDPILKGCILEKVKMPDGTDNSPYQIRDLGTIFYIQAVCEVLLKDETDG